MGARDLVIKKAKLCATDAMCKQSLLENCWIFPIILMISRPPKSGKTASESDEEFFLLATHYNFFLITLPVWEVSAFLSIALSLDKNTVRKLQKL